MRRSVISRSRVGGWGIAVLAALNLLLWAIVSPENDGREAFTTQFIGEMLSSSALILMSAGVVLVNRPRILEPYFGGLDRMYRMHQSAMTAAIALLLGHFLVVSYGRGIQLGASLGKIALIGLLVEVALALAPRIPLLGKQLRLPYHRWRIIHKFVGVFLIIGVLHTYRVDTLMQHSPAINVYVRTISFTGIGFYLYRELIRPFIQRGTAYRVADARRLNGTVIEASLLPVGKKLSHRAGQFLFVRFAQRGLNEPHPFTISSAPAEDRLRLTVRASGDFTQRMYDRLEAGMPASVEGGYGMFDYRAGGPEQIWIAGGIGITPFLSWLREPSASLDRRIDFFYSARSKEDALFEDEIRQIQARCPSLRVHSAYSNRDGHLTVEKVVETAGSPVEKDIYLCGPPVMMEAFIGGLRRMGTPASRIHYEEFNFR